MTIYGRVFDRPAPIVPRYLREVEALLGAEVGGWGLPGSRLPIWDGEKFNCRITFQHQGPADRVRAQITLKVGDQFPGILGDWVSIPEDTEWSTYTVATGEVLMNGAAALGEGRLIDGTAWLFSEKLGQIWTDMVDDGFITKRIVPLLGYTVAPAADSVQVWTPRG